MKKIICCRTKGSALFTTRFYFLIILIFNAALIIVCCSSAAPLSLRMTDSKPILVRKHKTENTRYHTEESRRLDNPHPGAQCTSASLAQIRVQELLGKQTSILHGFDMWPLKQWGRNNWALKTKQKNLII